MMSLYLKGLCQCYVAHCLLLKRTHHVLNDTYTGRIYVRERTIRFCYLDALSSLHRYNTSRTRKGDGPEHLGSFSGEALGVFHSVVKGSIVSL